MFRDNATDILIFGMKCGSFVIYIALNLGFDEHCGWMQNRW